MLCRSNLWLNHMVPSRSSTLLSSRLARSATAARNRANEAECGCEGEKEQRTDRWLRYEHALKQLSNGRSAHRHTLPRSLSYSSTLSHCFPPSSPFPFVLSFACLCRYFTVRPSLLVFACAAFIVFYPGSPARLSVLGPVVR